MRIVKVLLILGACFPGGVAFCQPKIDPVGSCAVIWVRGGGDLTPDLAQYCARMPVPIAGPTAYRAYYRNRAPFLAGAFETAERSACGFAGCLTGGDNVAVVLVPDELPNAFVSRKGDRIFAFVSSGLLNTIHVGVAGLMADLRAEDQGSASSNGLKAWMAAMRRAGGRPCDTNVALPTTAPEADVLKEVIVPTQMVLMFVFGHELAHVRRGAACGSASAGKLDIEEACDALAFQSLWPKKTVLPLFVAAWLTVMRYSEALRRGVLNDIYKIPGQPDSFRANFPARDWNVRAQQLLDNWTSACHSSPNDRLCDHTFLEMTRGWIDGGEPRTCVDPR